MRRKKTLVFKNSVFNKQEYFLTKYFYKKGGENIKLSKIENKCKNQSKIKNQIR